MQQLDLERVASSLESPVREYLEQHRVQMRLGAREDGTPCVQVNIGATNSHVLLDSPDFLPVRFELAHRYGMQPEDLHEILVRC